MKEATGEVSMTVITIVILALLVGVGTWLFNSNGPARQWIANFFGSEVANPESGDKTGPAVNIPE